MLFRSFYRSALFCGVLILFGQSGFSQARIGSIQGTVKDPTGALVPGAKVVVSQPVTKYQQTAQTDAQGVFKLVNIHFNN